MSGDDKWLFTKYVYVIYMFTQNIINVNSTVYNVSKNQLLILIYEFSNMLKWKERSYLYFNVITVSMVIYFQVFIYFFIGRIRNYDECKKHGVQQICISLM